MFGLTPFNRSQIQKRNNHDVSSFYDIFDDFFNDSFFNMRSLRNDTFKIDVKDQDGSYIVEAEMPGIKKEEIQLNYQDDCLTIGVQKQEEINEEKENFIHRERRHSSMQRNLYLKDIDVKSVEAKLEDGILKIVAPKSEPTSNKLQIDIK